MKHKVPRLAGEQGDQEIRDIEHMLQLYFVHPAVGFLVREYALNKTRHADGAVGMEQDTCNGRGKLTK